MALKLLRTWITEACNAACPFCMNQTARKTSQMSTLQFDRMCSYFKDKGVSMISLMGGEPTLHTEFDKITKIAQEYFETGYLFTNGIKAETLMKFQPRSTDSVIYNFNSVDLWAESIFSYQSGRKIIDVVIDQTTNVENLKKKFKELIDRFGGSFEIQLTMNNSTNIFIHRVSIADNICRIYNYLTLKFPHIPTVFQCGAPICFTYGLELPPYTPRTICPEESILIDGDFNVRFCNIHTQKLIPLFSDGNILAYQVLMNHIHLQSIKNQQICLEKICKNCILYPKQCNGKCYIAQECIKTNDIIKNTNLIWLKQLNISECI